VRLCRYMGTARDCLRFLWEGCDFRCDAVGGEGGGTAVVVDDVADFAFVAESDGDHIVKADVGVGGDFDGAGEPDVWTPEDAVNA
jgi:hypothetical protein